MKEDDSEDYEMEGAEGGADESEKAGHSAYVVPKDQKLHLSGMFQNWFVIQQ